MDRKIGSILGLAGGIVAVAGFVLPWVSFNFNLAALQEALGPLAALAEEGLRGVVPSSISATGLNIASEVQNLLSSMQQLPGGGAGVSASPAMSILALVSPVITLTLLLAILTAVFSGINLATGRFRFAVIGFGAGTLALSAILFFGIQMVVGAFYELIQQQATSTAGGLPGVAGPDLAATVGKIFSLSVGPGIYLCIVGGVLGVAGGVMGRKREKKEAAPAEAPIAPAPAAEEKK